MSDPGTPTLDQLQILLCVVDTGSFAAAARRLNRATSAITYAIDNLEFQLGLSIFIVVHCRQSRVAAIFLAWFSFSYALNSALIAAMVFADAWI